MFGEIRETRSGVPEGVLGAAALPLVAREPVSATSVNYDDSSKCDLRSSYRSDGEVMSDATEHYRSKRDMDAVIRTSGSTLGPEGHGEDYDYDGSRSIAWPNGKFDYLYFAEAGLNTSLTLTGEKDKVSCG